MRKIPHSKKKQYQKHTKRPDKSFFQEPQELEGLVNTGRVVQKFLPKQADRDKILKRIQKKVLKGTHLAVAIKEIQAGYLVNPHFKDIYLYLARNKSPSTKTAIQKVETLAEKYTLLESLLFKIVSTPEKETVLLTIPEICANKNYYTLSFKSICRTSRSHINLSHNEW